MKKIDPAILKRLREAKGWTQDVLAEKTGLYGLPKIDKQTISRLERGDRSKTRSRTIEQLARALSVEPAVLTGEKPAPERQREASSLDVRSQLNVRVGTAPRNALSLAARRYRVEPSQIVELAPFLFVWAAEESLRQRRDKMVEVKRACDAARDAESGIRHLPIPNYTYTEEKIAAESESVELRDLFGSSTQESTHYLDPYFSFDWETENPFALFLRNLVVPFGNVAAFEEWSGEWTPQYRVCPDEAAALVGGDHNTAEEIINGLVALSEMPKEIRGKADMAKERAEWVRSKAEEYRKQSLLDLAELGLVSQDSEPSK
jgi:transcriptional regulator with XRE-family HTH domain